ncbi:putative TdLSC37 protein [Hordeum vulgare]|nr:putative TdLSC37 protein [Hordeum vulgare]
MLFSITVEPWISVEEALIDLGRFAFRRPLGPMDAIAWQDLLECIALHEPNVERSIGCLSWRLEPSGCFSTKSLYRAIAPSPGTEPLTALSEIRLPLKNRIFLWQWLRGCLPSGVEVFLFDVLLTRVIKMYGYLQLWRSLSRSQDRDAINIIISRLRVMSLPPPPEPD